MGEGKGKPSNFLINFWLLDKCYKMCDFLWFLSSSVCQSKYNEMSLSKMKVIEVSFVSIFSTSYHAMPRGKTFGRLTVPTEASPGLGCGLHE